MRIDCKDLESILRDGDPEALGALEAHASGCAACGAELEIWRALERAAPALRREWESPALLLRIRRALDEERERQSLPFWRPAALRRSLAMHWQAAVAALLLAVFSGSAIWVLFRDRGGAPVAKQEAVKQERDRRLLTEQALRDIEKAEEAYIRTIERLQGVIEPTLEKPGSSLLLSYREKLTLIDAAISECRANIERNRFNAHLRGELLSIYREKEKTLEEILREEKNERN